MNANETLQTKREPRARRSVLSVPGSSPRMLEKALQLTADEILIDLEDAVAADAKADARDLVAGFLARDGEAAALMAVRVNALASPWGERDVVELARSSGTRIDSLVVPKVERAQDIRHVERLLESAGEGAAHVRLQALIETAGGLVHAVEIAAASPRLEALILGYADLAASLGRAPGPISPGNWLYAQETLLVAARAAGLQAIDGPYLDIRDDGRVADARRARPLPRLRRQMGRAPRPADGHQRGSSRPRRRRSLARRRSSTRSTPPRDAVRSRCDGEMIDEASRKFAAQIVARARAAGVGDAAQ